MLRVCFTLQLHREAVEEYRRRHADVWPDMRAALAEAGWHNFSLFLGAGGQVVGYVEVEHDFATAVEAMQGLDVNTRWQEHMAGLVDTAGQPADQSLQPLEELFHLP